MIWTLPFLALAAASDSEGGNEEAWAERFAQIDAWRKDCGIPVLSPQERMSFLLGFPQVPRDWIVTYHFLREDIDQLKTPESVGFSVVLLRQEPGTTYWTLHRKWGGYRIDQAIEEATRISRNLLVGLDLSITLFRPVSETKYETEHLK